MTVIAYQFPHGWFWKNKLRNVIAAGAPSQVCIKMSHILNEWSGVATGRVEVATAECTTVRTWHAPADGDGPAGWTFPPAAQQQPPPKLSILLPSPSKKTDSPPFDLSPPRHPYHSFGLAPWWSSLSLYPPSPERERERSENGIHGRGRLDHLSIPGSTGVAFPSSSLFWSSVCRPVEQCDDMTSSPRRQPLEECRRYFMYFPL